MAKLIVRFAKKIIRVITLEQQVPLLLGRSSDCGLRIDSIRCAPEHATIIRDNQSGTYQINPVDAEHFPLQINHHTVSSYTLEHGDMLHFGDYQIEFVSSAQRFHDPIQHPAPAEEEHDQRLWSVKMAERQNPALLQILNGPRMGRIIKLTRERLTLGGKGKECAFIHHQTEENHYRLLANQSQRVEINGQPFKEGESKILCNGDRIQIDGLQMEFQQEKQNN